MNEQWANRFIVDLQHLKLTARIHNNLARLLSGYYSSDQTSLIRQIFCVDGRYVNFEEWVMIARERRRSLRSVRNMGNQSVDEIFAAIDDYKRTCSKDVELGILSSGELSCKESLFAEIVEIEKHLAALKQKLLTDN